MTPMKRHGRKSTKATTPTKPATKPVTKSATKPATSADISEAEIEELGDSVGTMDGFGGGSTPRKAKAFWPSATRMVGLLAPQKAALAVVFAMVIISVVLSVIAPKILGKAMDVIFGGVISKQMPSGITKEQAIEGARAQGQEKLADMLTAVDVVPGQGIDFDKLGHYLLIVLAMYAVSVLFMWLQGRILNSLVMRVIYDLRREVENKINRLPLSYFDTRQRGDLLSRTTNDVDNVQQALQQAISQLIHSALTILGIIVMMFIVSWQLALIALVSLPLTALVIGIIGGKSQKLFADQWRETGRLNGHIEESFTGHELIQAYGRGADMQDVFDARNDQLFESASRAQFYSMMMMPLMQWLSYLSYVGIAVVGGLRVASGSLTLGDATAFIQYSREFNQPLGQLAGMMNMLQSGVASAERIFELLDAEEEKQDVAGLDGQAGQEAAGLDGRNEAGQNVAGLDGQAGQKAARSPLATRSEGAVEFRDVSFSYVEDKPLIRDLNLTVRPGQTVAIVGPTGAGKTTLVNLIMRFYELDGGQILLDGVDTARLSRQQLRSQVGMVLQDAVLFEGTIMDNIRYGRLDATDEEVIAAAKATFVDRFVHALPDGYQTVISQDSGSVSAGERQLITIARAFLAEPALLILDEATSSVDTRTEALVQKAMSALQSDRTSFVIAHRLSTIRDADVILVMKDGSIVEQGNHEELLAQGGEYAQLYAASVN
ncbi:ABC transporter ATP-binding protein [Corynebacterium auriscanis]|uniref:ABC transporter ATP-binding protein n=1 Tax=Corynebacterium auriscanis TaxID=99807 RepID=UPI003CCC4A21|nr:putative ABC transporter ATP-binding protein [Corynebacterium auriscanis]